MKHLMWLPLLLLSGTLLTDCRKSDPAPIQTVDTTDTVPPAPERKRWLALGDSYTIGQSVPELERFPAQTIDSLFQRGLFINDLTYIAATGWTCSALESTIDSRMATLQTPYAIVSLLIGVNDQYPYRDTFLYREKFTRLLGKAISLAGNRTDRVFVLSIPDYSVTPFAQGNDTTLIRQQLDRFNAVNKEVSYQFGVSYTDITPSTRQARYDKTLLAYDSLHPSGKEYAKWAHLLAPKIRQVFN